MKKLALMRHGDYDSQYLSPFGRKQADVAAEKMIEADLVPDIIVHSPVLRAVETAQRVRDIFAAKAGKQVPLVENDALKVGSTRLRDLFASVGNDNEVVLAVTHQPNVESLASQLDAHEYISPQTAEVNVFEANTDTWRSVRAAKHVKKL